ESSRGVPFAAVGEALAGALRATPDELLAEVVGNGGSDLVALMPNIRTRLDRLGIDSAPHALQAPDQMASRVTESIVGTLEQLGPAGVVLLALEDLHWADPATPSLVMSLLRMSRRMPLCLLVTFQPDALHRRHPAMPFAQALSATADVEWISLAALTR